MRLPEHLENDLHEIVKQKRGHIAQMEAHRDLQKRWGHKKLAHATKSHIDDDRDHVKAINKYIVERGGVPRNETGNSTIHTEPEKQIASDLTNERDHVDRLNKFIVKSRDSGEDKPRRVVEHVLKDDEKHVAELEKHQSLIHKIGLQNYLTKVSKV